MYGTIMIVLITIHSTNASLEYSPTTWYDREDERPGRSMEGKVIAYNPFIECSEWPLASQVPNLRSLDYDVIVET